jgi:hypothetical protein
MKAEFHQITPLPVNVGANELAHFLAFENVPKARKIQVSR